MRSARSDRGQPRCCLLLLRSHCWLPWMCQSLWGLPAGGRVSGAPARCAGPAQSSGCGGPAEDSLTDWKCCGRTPSCLSVLGERSIHRVPPRTSHMPAWALASLARCSVPGLALGEAGCHLRVLIFRWKLTEPNMCHFILFLVLRERALQLWPFVGCGLFRSRE